MEVRERQAGDLDELRGRARDERHALRRDRWRAVVLALGGNDAPATASMLGRARRSVQDWCYAYRDGGVEAVQPKPRPGRKPKLARGRDVVKILEAEVGVRYTLDGAHALLHRLGYSLLCPRPRHGKADAAEQQRFREQAPLLSAR